MERKKSTVWVVILWTLRIVLFPILIPFWYLPKGIWLLNRYGWKSLDENFFSFIRGQVTRDKSGKIMQIKFCSYEDVVHFHYCVWGGLICALLAWIVPSIVNILAIFVILLPIFSVIIVKYEFPFRKIWKTFLAIVILVPLADYGLFKGTFWLTSQTFPWLEAHASWLGITSSNIGGYEIGWIIAKCFGAFHMSVSAGTFLFMAIAWGLFLVGTTLESWAYNRYEFSAKASEIHNHKLFTAMVTEPIFMRGITIDLKDIFEVFPFGFASLRIQGKNGERLLTNIPFLGGFGKFPKAMRELIAGPNFTNDGDYMAQSAISNDEVADEVPNDSDSHIA